MAYAIGSVLSLVVAVFARVVGFDRDRAFYSTVVIVVATYYVLFAAMTGSTQTVLMECVIAGVFVTAAVAGFKRSTWIVVAALAGHGLMDFVHGNLVANAGVPVFWPAFCASYDLGAAAWLSWIVLRGRA